MIKQWAACFLFGLLAVALFTATSKAQQQGEDKTQVMILGVYHFNNPNADLVKTAFPDHLSENKQHEIAEVLDLLAKFKPNKMVVEAPPERVDVQNNYQAYLQGDYKLTANETEQIGYRLAKRFGHQQVYLVDHRMGMDFDSVMVAAGGDEQPILSRSISKCNRRCSGDAGASCANDRARGIGGTQ